MSTFIKKAAAIVAVGSLVGTLAACGGSDDKSSTDSATTVKIGYVGSLTGPLAESGKVELAGLKAAAQYVDATYPGTKIEISSRDTKGEPTAAVAATRSLAQEGVTAMYYSTEAFPAAQTVLNQVKIPGATAGGIGAILNEVGDSKRYKYAFSTGAGTSGETSITPLLAYAASAGNTVAMLDDSSAYGTSQSETTLALAKSNFPDIKIVHQSFPSTASDVTAQLNKLKASGAKSLIVWSYGAPLIATMSSLNKIGWNPQMSAVLGIGDPASAKLIPEGMKSTMAAGPMAKTFLSTQEGAAPTGITAEFVKLYLGIEGRSEFNALDTVGAIPFDWALIVTEAARKIGSTDPDKVKDALVGGTSYTGANGEYTFGPDQRVGIPAEGLGVFVPAKPCTAGTCVDAQLGASK